MAETPSITIRLTPKDRAILERLCRQQGDVSMAAVVRSRLRGEGVYVREETLALLRALVAATGQSMPELVHELAAERYETVEAEAESTAPPALA